VDDVYGCGSLQVLIKYRECTWLHEMLFECAIRADMSQLIYRTKSTTKKWKNRKKKLKRDMLRSIGKQSGESMQSVRKRKKKATVGRICRKKVLSLE